MKLENIKEARILIDEIDTLQDILDNADMWKGGHFEFVEHYGNAPDRIVLCSDLKELKQAFLDAVKANITTINEKLKEL